MRKIIHIDMDCFYAAVEMRDFPKYRDIPLAVGGDGPRSVLCTCNYQARKYGVRSAMPASKAKLLCPELTIVHGRMSVYKEVSAHIREIFSRYTHLIEPLSLDEAFLDVTDSVQCHGSATLIAEKIRSDIYNELNLTASAGVAPNKFIAKIASDENKPNGQCVVPPDQVSQFVEQLSLKKIPGIGPKTFQKLQSFGFTTCADVRASSINHLATIVGKFATSLYQKSHGIDNRELEVSRQRKSLAIETTLMTDVYSEAECLRVIEKLYPKLVERLAKVEGRQIVRQGIKLKFNDFNQTTVEQQSLAAEENTFHRLLLKAHERSKGRGIRLVGLTLGFAEPSIEKNTQCKQLSLL
ncbi:DNA polymerase IV [Colwellia sp. 4_MG-2023]|uniref:DNA polymerase IV n=1 Tax=unclassified Colwellia TaxID=196834 RepID=UPI001C095449|nr:MULTISPECIES: DNA polymerase IV [unclassified Colwellia]MBU2923299.1 DNA polymerase IV [Colwellia sp. C2M11]MDO6507928.1 DNA polymerase IV [Colwellia sp. 5_MG-2023]MDO6556668.1 DNA polymerase IV [Colwellia sp. 4_MG-2023]MDO6653714.1 DNA polymerase IV [Colwellia sp. 3_MG-2023]MDO6666525.1 DNA polymerase IV [Colwellia sp. 2_MG-2023]